ncbi:MAG TPA: hypothetical protein PL009_14400 [Flavipsychrobacter sp.]|nr:hypothetical protein [Flavipsychrobacter sp.]
MQPIALNLRGIPVSSLLTRARHILKSIRQHPDVFTNLPVSLDVLEERLDQLSKAEQQMMARNYSNKSQRDAAEQDVKRMLKQLANHVSNIAEDDTTIIMMAGMEMKKAAVKSLAVPPVSIKWVRTGMSEGSVKLMVKRERVHRALQVQISYDLSNPNGWQEQHYGSDSRIILHGLTPLSKLWVRVRGLCTAQRTTDWTEPVGVKVL